MNFRIALVAVVVASALSFSAHATTTDWGVHDPLEVAASITPIGTFEDNYLVNLPTAYSLGSTARIQRLYWGARTGDADAVWNLDAGDDAMGGIFFNHQLARIAKQRLQALAHIG